MKEAGLLKGASISLPVIDSIHDIRLTVEFNNIAAAILFYESRGKYGVVHPAEAARFPVTERIGIRHFSIAILIIRWNHIVRQFQTIGSPGRDLQHSTA